MDTLSEALTPLSMLPKDILECICYKMKNTDINSLEQVSRSFRTDLVNYLSFSRKEPTSDPDIYEDLLFCKDHLDILSSINIDKVYAASRFPRYSRFKYDLLHCIHIYECTRLHVHCNLTPEQEQVASFNGNQGSVILVQAFAGTGKTKTLIEYCNRQDPTSKILYLAFNSSLSSSAKKTSMGKLDNVHISTIHAFAKHGLHDDYEVRNLSIETIMDFLNISRCDAGVTSFLLNNFLSSISNKISPEHLKNKRNTLSGPSAEQYFVHCAQQLWDAFLSKSLPMTHDAYLKLYQLQKPLIDADHILLDEAQDSTPCVLNIIFRQKHSTRIIVGDVNQQIYGFRGVCNPFSHNIRSNNPITRIYLDTTFRFGPELTFLTNKFLSTFKKYSGCIISNLSGNYTKVYPSSHILDPLKTYVLICRSNYNSFIQAFQLCLHYRICFKDACQLDCDEEIEIMRSLDCIHTGIGENTHSDIQGFESLNTVIEHFKLLADSKWLTRVNLYKRIGFDTMITNWNTLKQNITLTVDDAQIIITTAHQSKGLEFDNVIISDDYVKLVYSTGKLNIRKDNDSEYNVLYVAMTRAKKELILNEELSTFVNISRMSRDVFIRGSIKESCHTCGSQTDGMQFYRHSWSHTTPPFLIPICSLCYITFL